LRASIDARAASEGWPALHAELAVRDPHSAARIHPNDAQRIQRALEVLVLSGRARAGHWADQPQHPDFSRWMVCMLEPRERAQLHQVIAARFASMLANGLVDEVRQLLARGLDEHSPVLRLVGYRQLVAHCRGQESVESATDRAIAATRQLAKRQLTWMRSGKLLPSGATVLRAEPFDLITLEGVTAGLIKAIPAPC
jgi:tRNA dimethylallyltransferase